MEPIIPNNFAIIDVAILDHEVDDSLVLRWVMGVGLDADDICGHGVKVKGLQHCKFCSLHIQAPEIDVMGAEFGEHGGKGHAGDHGQAVLLHTLVPQLLEAFRHHLVMNSIQPQRQCFAATASVHSSFCWQAAIAFGKVDACISLRSSPHRCQTDFRAKSLMTPNTEQGSS